MPTSIRVAAARERADGQRKVKWQRGAAKAGAVLFLSNVRLAPSVISAGAGASWGRNGMTPHIVGRVNPGWSRTRGNTKGASAVDRDVVTLQRQDGVGGS